VGRFRRGRFLELRLEGLMTDLLGHPIKLHRHCSQTVAADDALIRALMDMTNKHRIDSVRAIAGAAQYAALLRVQQQQH
jgi:hypothetical protein